MTEAFGYADDLPKLDAAVQVLARLARMLEQTPTELPLAQFRVLALVASGERRASRLASRLPVAKPTVTAAVDALVAAGLLVRERDVTDGRVVSLAITARGRAVLKATGDALAARLRPHIAAVSEPARLLGLLVELGDAIDRSHEIRPGRAER
jgi:DNA-binding MarR family transcriptional regulator